MPIAHFDAAAMPFHDRPRDGEAEAGMAAEIRFRPDRMETVKDRLTRIFGDAAAFVLNADFHLITVGRGASESPSVMVVKLPATSHSGAGIDWGDASIGASGALVVLALTAGGTVAVQRRRHVRADRTPATA